MRAHYFAFGSNMSSARLRRRIPTAQPVGCGRLEGWRFACNKAGNDGSAKANVVREPGAVVWGVVFRIPLHALPRLDRIEGGYRRIEVEVALAEASLLCHTYASDRVMLEAEIFDWYKRHIVIGAEEHGLPGDYVEMLRALRERVAVRREQLC